MYRQGAAMNRAVEDFLSRLIPADEIRLTREKGQ